MSGDTPNVDGRTTESDPRSARLRAEARLAAHPGYVAFQDHQAFKVTLDGVFWPNYLELKALLDQAATDHDLGIELIQNVYDDSVARQFTAEASRRLHNYVAATMSLVEHSRRLMRDRDDEVRKAWDVRLAELLTNGEVPMLIDLRAFIQHRSLPVLAHSLRIDSPNTPEAKWESEVELGRDRLLSWPKWRSAARSFLEGQDPAIKLRPLVEKHAGLVWEANAWLLKLLLDDNHSALEEANRLVVEVNQAMLGTSFEEAEAFTLRTSVERQQPRPTTTQASDHGRGMSRSDGNAAVKAVRMAAAMWHDMEARGDGLVGLEGLGSVLILNADSSLSDMLAGNVIASRVALNTAKAAAQCSAADTAQKIIVILDRMAREDAMGLDYDKPYEDAKVAVQHLAKMLDESVALRPQEIFDQPSDSALAFVVLLWALIQHLANMVGMTQLQAAQRLIAKIEANTNDEPASGLLQID